MGDDRRNTMAIGKFSEKKSWLGKLGAALDLPEMGLSELLSRNRDTRAMKLARDNAATRVVGAQASGMSYPGQYRAFFSPNSYGSVGGGGQDYYNAGSSTLSAMAGSNPLTKPAAKYKAEKAAAEKAAAEEAARLAAANTLGGDTATETPAFAPVTFLGQVYTDPESLAIAKRNYLDRLNREKLSEIVAGLNKYIGGENVTFDTVGGELGQSKTSFLDQVARMLDEYNTGEQKDYGKIRGYYSGLGDMYQSSQEIRNRNVADEYNKARTDLETQKQTGLTGLQRTFQDYIDQANANKTALARNYQTSLDELANANESDIQNTVASGLGGQSVQITSPTIKNNLGTTSTSLLNSLQRVKNNVFRLNRGDNTEKDILSYLYQGM